MRLKAWVAAAAVALSSPAMADVFDFGEVTLSQGDSFFGLGFVMHDVGAFEDYFLFSLNDPGVTLWRGAANFNTPTLANFSTIGLGKLEIYFDRGAHGVDGDDVLAGELASGNDISYVNDGLNNDSYYLKYSGVVSGPTAAIYSYALGVEVAAGVRSVTAVPEPDTYAMVLAGLGMLGVVARRRR